MKALVLAPQPFFSPRGTPFSVYYRTRAMASLGEEIDLLTYGQGRNVDIDRVHIFRTPALRMLGAVRTGPSLLKVLHDTLLFVRACVLLIRHKYDYVHAHEEAVFIAAALRPLFRFRLVYDMHSSLPEQLSNFSWTRSRLLISAFRRAERRVLASADVVIVVYPSLLRYASGFVSDPDKIILIENVLFDAIRFTDNEPDDAGTGIVALARSLVDNGHPLIVYAGTLEPYQGIELLLEAFALVTERHPALRLIIIGGTPEQVGRYRRMADGMHIGDRCSFAGTVAPDAATAVTALSAMHVSPRRRGTNTPMKVYYQLASGIPIVATRIESHTQVLDDDVATLVKPDARDLARGIVEVLDDPGAAAEKAARARARYEEYYSPASYERATRALLSMLRRDAADS